MEIYFPHTVDKIRNKLLSMPVILGHTILRKFVHFLLIYEHETKINTLVLHKNL